MTCSGVPLPAIPEAASPDPMIAMPMPASPQNSSSTATGSVRPVGSEMAFIRKSTLYSPIWAASSTIGHGNSSRSSHSWAAGRTTSSAKSWIHFWICSWSSSRFSEKCVMTLSYQRVTPMSTAGNFAIQRRITVPAGVVSTIHPSACSVARMSSARV